MMKLPNRDVKDANKPSYVKLLVALFLGKLTAYVLYLFVFN